MANVEPRIRIPAVSAGTVEKPSKTPGRLQHPMAPAAPVQPAPSSYYIPPVGATAPGTATPAVDTQIPQVPEAMPVQPAAVGAAKPARNWLAILQLNCLSRVVADISYTYWVCRYCPRSVLALPCKKGPVKNPGDCRPRNHYRAAGNCSQFLLAGYLPATGNPPPDKIMKITVLPPSFLFPFSYYQ